MVPYYERLLNVHADSQCGRDTVVIDYFVAECDQLNTVIISRLWMYVSGLTLGRVGVSSIKHHRIRICGIPPPFFSRESPTPDTPALDEVTKNVSD